MHERPSCQQHIVEVDQVTTDTDLSTRLIYLHENDVMECEIPSLSANDKKKSSDHTARRQGNHDRKNHVILFATTSKTITSEQCFNFLLQEP